MYARRKVALLCIDPLVADTPYRPFNYAIRRVQAALLAANIDGVEVHLVEARVGNTDGLLAELEAIDPDIVGASAYVWSFAIFVDLAERLKRRRRDLTVIFGGPSARPAMFALEPYHERRFAVDALVLGEGEEIFSRIVALAARGPDALASIPGLALPTRDGWHRTGEASLVTQLDALASPYQMGLVQPGHSPHIESFRGCPLSCSFCQWGDSAGNSRIFSTEYLVRELEACRSLGLSEALLVDAALNLNPRAFRNLAAAEREVRLLRDIGLSLEIYPSHLTDEHLAFISEIRRLSIGLGLQSYDEEVLRRLQRPFDAARFERVARQVHEIGAEGTIEIIMGLPGDGPDTFLRTLERARALPCHVRIYHCLVLPDALMTRGPAWADMDFDPRTLLMRSCSGWSEADIQAMSEHLTSICDQAEGWAPLWSFRNTDLFRSPGTRSAAPVPALPSVVTEAPAAEVPAAEVLAAEAVARVSSIVSAATQGRWTIEEVQRREGVVLLSASTPDGPCTLQLAPARSGARAYRVVGDVAISYREGGATPTPDFLKTLDLLSVRAAPLFKRLVHGGDALDTRSAPSAPRARSALPIAR